MEKDATNVKGEAILSRMALNDNKAGMEGLDRGKINAIIMEASKGSRFYENELKRDQQVNQRIEKMMQQNASITEEQLQKAHVKVKKMATEMEKRRDLSRIIVHVDMDAFYAAVEMRDCPELKDKPMAVGSMSMLSTSNYHARKYGVRAAMPGFIAKKLCPNLVIVPTNFDKYKAVSKEVQAIFAEYDPHFQPLSLDEAYLDFTEHLEQRKSWPESARTHFYSNSSNNNDEAQMEPVDMTEDVKDLSPVLFEDSPSSSPVLTSCGSGATVGRACEVFGTSDEEAVREMRFRIEQKTALTASAGIAPNMLLAKVCSDKNKPNGQYRLPPTRDAVMDFIHNLPVRKVPGIGKVSEKMLKALGICNCSDLGQQMALLSLLFSETAWHHFIELSLGLSSTYIPKNEERKSMSTERTFKELSRPEEQFAFCRELCDDLAEDMKKEGLKGKTVTVKLKNVHFEVKTRAVTLQCAVATAEEIFAIAKDLLKIEMENVAPHLLRLRLMGVRVSAFVSSEDKKPQQKSIVGFFQQGKKDCSASSGSLQELPQLEKPKFLRQSKQDVHEEHKASDKPKLSFFQMAQVKRLQVEAEKAASRNIGKKEKPYTSVNNEQSNNEISTENVEPQNNASHLPAQSISPSPEPQPSTSGCGGPSSEGLTCPVCFCRVNTTNLNIFNNHIDLCLKGITIREDQITDSESDLSSQNTDIPTCISDKCNLEENKTTEISGQDFRGTNPQEGYKNGGTGDDDISDSDANISSKQPKSCDDQCPVLICPVCHKTQDTNDLTIFNHHVDLCLNQKVLHMFEGQEAMPVKPASVKVRNNKGTVSNQLMRKTTKGKTKRRDSPSSPPSKKAKGLGPRNTIDRFFR